MRRSRCVMSAACLLAATSAAIGASPTDFRLTAAIEGDFSPDAPVCVSLTREIIAEARADFADVRVFDDLGQETPYVIYRQTEARAIPQSFTFAVISYDEAEGADEITLKRPDDASPFREVELVIAGTDFKKHVRVEAGPALDTMHEIATDTIFDFSARLDLRKTTVAIPQTDATFLRLTLRDAAPPPAGGPEMRLRYEGLEFWAEGMRAGRFRVERILGWSGERKSTEYHFDDITIEAPTVQTDGNGNSVILLDSKLPVAHVTFDVENAYYYRRVQLLTATVDREEDYRVAATGVIYKFPDITEPKNTVVFDQPSRYVRLKVLNEDNPPLRVRAVEIAWVRQNLYFVPAARRSYALHVGSELVAPPQYELRRLIPSDFAKLRHYASMSVLGLKPNTGYEPRLKPGTREALEKAVFVGLMVVLVCVLLVWALRLLRKIPAEGGRPASGDQRHDPDSGGRPDHRGSDQV